MHLMPRQLYYVTGGALVVRLFLVLAIMLFLGENALFVSDAPRFYKIAASLAGGHGFTIGDFPYEPSAFFPPIFFIILGGSLAVFHSWLPLVFFHIILGSLLPIFVWGISGFFIKDYHVRLLAAGLTAFEPQMILWSIVPTTEMIATFTMIASFYFFLKIIRDFRWQDALFSGLFLGLSTLTRPHGQFLFMLGTAFLILFFYSGVFSRLVARSRYFVSHDNGRSDLLGSAEGGKSRRPLVSEPLERANRVVKTKYRGNRVVIIAFVATFLLTVSPWIIRNYYHFGTFSISTTGLRNIYSDYAVAVKSVKTGVPFGEMRTQMYKELAEKYGVTSKEIREDPALGDTVAGEGFRIIFSHPKESIQVLASALVAFFTQDLYTFYLQHFRVIPEFRIDFSPSVVLVREGPFSLANRIWESLGMKAFLPVLGRIIWVAFSILWILGAIFLIRQKGQQRIFALIMAVVIFYYALTSAVGAFSDQGRLRYPVNSLIFVLASVGFFSLMPHSSIVAQETKIESI